MRARAARRSRRAHSSAQRVRSALGARALRYPARRLAGLELCVRALRRLEPHALDDQLRARAAASGALRAGLFDERLWRERPPLRRRREELQRRLRRRRRRRAGRAWRNLVAVGAWQALDPEPRLEADHKHRLGSSSEPDGAVSVASTDADSARSAGSGEGGCASIGSRRTDAWSPAPRTSTNPSQRWPP